MRPGRRDHERQSRRPGGLGEPHEASRSRTPPWSTTQNSYRDEACRAGARFLLRPRRPEAPEQRRNSGSSLLSSSVATRSARSAIRLVAGWPSGPFELFGRWCAPRSPFGQPFLGGKGQYRARPHKQDDDDFGALALAEARSRPGSTGFGDAMRWSRFRSPCGGSTATTGAGTSPPPSRTTASSRCSRSYWCSSPCSAMCSMAGPRSSIGSSAPPSPSSR